LGAPPPVIFSRPANMLSTRPELRARTSENELRFAITPCSGWALSVSMPSSCARAVFAVRVRLCVSSTVAMSSGGSPSAPGFRIAVETPPVSETVALPIRPCASMPTCVSCRTGVVASTAICAINILGAPESKRTEVTSPTRSPLKSTATPGLNPMTGASKRMR
jgi:hypothetical protein